MAAAFYREGAKMIRSAVHSSPVWQAPVFQCLRRSAIETMTVVLGNNVNLDFASHERAAHPIVIVRTVSAVSVVRACPMSRFVAAIPTAPPVKYVSMERVK